MVIYYCCILVIVLLNNLGSFRIPVTHLVSSDAMEPIMIMIVLENNNDSIVFQVFLHKICCILPFEWQQSHIYLTTYAKSFPSQDVYFTTSDKSLASSVSFTCICVTFLRHFSSSFLYCFRRQ